MKLLLITQTIDRNDLYLGFFHRWVEELAKHTEKITVVCLTEGEHALPANVQVLSLGKEQGTSRLGRAVRLFRYSRSAQYDAVLVHMNQEYPLLAGWYWALRGKRIYMWRNHYAGNLLTDIAAAFCTKVFCTSKYSYTAKYKKTVLMPVGVDTILYRSVAAPLPRSILFYARIAPSKRADLLVEALGVLKAKGVTYSADIYGSPLPVDKLYLVELKDRVAALGIGGQVKFFPGAPHAEGPNIFSTHEIFVDPSRSGMFNKMLFEAAACGALPLAVSEDWAALAGKDLQFAPTVTALADALERMLAGGEESKKVQRERLRVVVQGNSLEVLAKRLVRAMEYHKH